ncbi:MAG: ATP-binding cassette domain-containing protein, partial [Spirochaetaceae bacterium]|nr:ATP-binding cassette domain-containing protein [Spirochaetaceae bacterium]
MAYITAENLLLGYDNTPVAAPLSFSVSKGDYLCIIGENGSGKTTLIKTLLKLIKPLSGSLQTGDGLLPNEIGYLPQQSAIQKDFPASVFEIVLSGTLPKCGFKP